MSQQQRFTTRINTQDILRINQNGFRARRSTLSEILTLRRLIEGIKDNQLPAILTFVDFSEAFDSIHGDFKSLRCNVENSGCHINILYTKIL